MTSRHMWTIVCDDVRQEVGNKISFMGVYGGEIIVASLPATFPKLTATIYVRTLVSDPFERLVIRVLNDETELARAEMERDQLNAAQIAREGINDDSYLTVAFTCQFTPFIIEQASVLRFRADTERETLKGGSVQIKALANIPAATVPVKN